MYRLATKRTEMKNRR